MTEHDEPPDPKQLLQTHGLWAKKGFGQNFLRDYRIHQRVATALEGQPGDTVVELGSGLGTLTWYLAKTGMKVIAVERDREIAPILRQVVAEFPNVLVSEGNAKALDYSAYKPSGGALRVAGNIPYNLTSPILFSLFEQRAVIKTVALLVQKEVADRIVADAGSKTYGLMSVVLGSVAKVRRVCVVPRGAFHPAPRVDSAVIAWTFRDDAAALDGDALVAIAKAAFQQRRKTLRNALKPFGEPMREALAALGISDERRPETLTPDDFVRLTQALSAAGEPAPAR